MNGLRVENVPALWLQQLQGPLVQLQHCTEQENIKTDNKFVHNKAPDPDLNRVPAQNAGQGYRIPKADQGFRIPKADLGFRIPKADLGFRIPKADLEFRIPKADLGFRIPKADLGFRIPKADLGFRIPKAAQGVRIPKADLNSLPSLQNSLKGHGNKADFLGFLHKWVRHTYLLRVRFFFSEPSATGGYNWLPAPPGCNLANAGNTKQ
jgi:hypothetical protein